MKYRLFKRDVSEETAQRPSKLLSKERVVPLAKAAFMHGVAALLAGLLQGMNLTENVSPAGLAFVIGIDKKYSISAALGFMLGAWVNGAAHNSVYMSAAGIAVVVRLVLVKRKMSPDRLLYASMASGLMTLFLSRISVLALTGGITVDAVMLSVCETVLTGALSVFFFIGCRYALNRKAEITASHRVCIYISVFCASAAVSTLNVGFISIGRIVLFLCLAALCSQSPAFALELSAFVAAGMAAAQPPFYFAAIGCVAAVAAGSAFKHFSKLIFTVAFLICGYAAALMSVNITFALIYVCELSIAAAIYVVLPSSVIARLFTRGESRTLSGAIASSRLSAMSLSFSELSRLLERICTVIPKHEIADNIVSCTADAVCRGCSMMSFCWVKHYGDTVSGMMKLTEMIRKNGKVTPSDMPGELRSSCINPLSVCDKLNSSGAALRGAVNRQKNTALYRTVMYKQFAAVGEMLRATESTLSSMGGFEPRTDSRIRAVAADLGIPVAEIQTAYINGRMRCAASFSSSPTAEQRRLLASKIGLITGVRVCEAQATLSDFGTAIEYCEQPLFELKTASFQNNPNRDSGDSYSIFDDCAGKRHIVVADGMGTGRAAALDSAICCAFMRRLLENGFDGESGARLVNAAMAIKDEGEAAVTVDCLEFDGYTGKATLLKAGAAPTYISRRGELSALCHPTLPVGIMDEICTETTDFTLGDGDIAVMLTDGALEGVGKPIVDIIRENRSRTPKELLAEILANADGFREADDDITVIVAKIAVAEQE